MGGASTEVGEGTTSILLEAARFDPPTIRRTSSRLGLRSEASSRFERGLSPELAMHAARRATKFFVELCGGTARRGAVDVYPRQHHAPQVTVSRRRLDTVIGFHVPDDEVEGNLRALGFEVDHVNRGDADHFAVQPPWWRTDVSIPDDVAEEIVRIAGYDRLVATTLAGRIPRHEPRSLSELRERLRDALVEAGLYEVISYSLTTEDVLRRVMPADELATLRPLRVANPLSSDRELLRPTLRHALLEAVERNVRAGAPDVALFETARVYLSGESAGDLLPEEREMLVAAISGTELDRWGQPAARPLDFFDAKGMLEQALAELGVTLDFVADEEFAMLPGHTARLRAGGEPVGVLAEVHPQTLVQFGIEQPVALFELDLARLLPHVPERRQASAVPRYPAVEQDLAIVVDSAVEAGALQTVVEGSPLVAEARVFDVYHGEQLAEGKKSVALSIRYQAADRTLTTDDANAEQARILARLERELGAESAVVTRFVREGSRGLRRQRDLRLLRELAEGVRVPHRQVGEHPAVDLDAGALEAVDQPPVGEVVQAGGGVDAHDPQPPEVTLAPAAVPPRVAQGVHHRLVSDLVVFVALAAMPARAGDHFLVAGVRGDAAAGSGHLGSSLLGVAPTLSG